MDKFSIYSNEALYQKKFSYKFLLLIVLFLIGSIIYLIFFTDKYDVYQMKGVIKCDKSCIISITISASDTEKVQRAEKVYLQDKEIDIKDIQVGEIVSDYEALESYQTINYELAKKVNYKTEIVTISILSNKHRLINKINPFKEGG